MKEDIYIYSQSLLSCIGSTPSQSYGNLLAGKTGLLFEANAGLPVGFLDESSNAKLTTTREEIDSSGRLDKTAIMAAHCATECLKNISHNPQELGVICGSSRGPAESWEKHLRSFFEDGKSSALASPSTTPITLTATAAKAVNAQGPMLYLSTACQTGLSAIGTAFALIQAGQSDSFLAGAVEACVTPFTLNALRSLKIVSTARDNYPAKPGEANRDGMVLAEGAGMFLISKKSTFKGDGPKPLARILAYAGASEGGTLTGVTENGDALRNCLKKIFRDQEAPNFIAGHLPGTKNGDAAETKAIRNFFPQIPITAFKWATGHALAASPCLSLSLSLECLKSGTLPALPYAGNYNLLKTKCLWENLREPLNGNFQRVLITSLGFGGNASALLIETAKS